MSDKLLKRARREKQIWEMVQEHFNELAATDKEIDAVERELWNKPGLAQEWLCLTNTERTAVNMLYICIAVGNLRSRDAKQ